MGAFDEHFKISASRNPQILGMCTMDLVSSFNPNLAELVKKMKTDLDQRNIHVDEERGPLNRDGALSLIFASTDSSAVVRIGEWDNPPDSVIILRPAARFVYKGDGPEAEYQAHIMPFAPDNGEVTVEDMIRTMRVLKAEGLEQKFLDLGADPQNLLGQFVFLKGIDGKIISYPDNTDSDMAGKPIAFVRDLNCIQGRDDALKRMEALGGNADDFIQNVVKYFKAKCTENGKTDNEKLATMLTISGIRLPEGPFDPDKADLKISNLAMAPQDCVDACHQQDALAERARMELTAKGVRLDGPSI